MGWPSLQQQRELITLSWYKAYQTQYKIGSVQPVVWRKAKMLQETQRARPSSPWDRKSNLCLETMITIWIEISSIRSRLRCTRCLREAPLLHQHPTIHPLSNNFRLIQTTIVMVVNMLFQRRSSTTAQQIICEPSISVSIIDHQDTSSMITHNLYPAWSDSKTRRRAQSSLNPQSRPPKLVQYHKMTSCWWALGTT